MGIRGYLKRIHGSIDLRRLSREYYKRFCTFAYRDCECKSREQFEASIIRLYHTIEKGLSYLNYKAGFGRDNVEKLVRSLEQYAESGYDVTEFFYETALSCLHAYVRKNKEFGYEDAALEQRIGKIKGKANECGGTISVSLPVGNERKNYEELVKSRHSIRRFSDEPINIEAVQAAICLAQYTPSACNRQGWRTRIIQDPKKKEIILANQNGNRGFGQGFDKILVVTADLRAQQVERELFQAFIDGGMYAESILNALYYMGIGCVPLSASLTMRQERTIREAIGLDEAEVLILFAGIGNYPKEAVVTTRSERKPAVVEII